MSTWTFSTRPARCSRHSAPLFGYRTAAEYWFPSIRSLPGAIFVMSLVLYPYVYLAARAMFLTQSASLIEVARTLGASRLMLVRHVALPLARPALAVGLSLALLEALNDIGASEYLGVQTLTLSIFTTWINRSSLPGRGADRLRDAGHRDRADGARTTTAARHRRFMVSLRRQRIVPRIPLAGRARLRRDFVLPGSGPARLRPALRFSSPGR